MKQNHKILLGIGIGAGLAYVLHRMSKNNGNGATASIPSGASSEPTRGEKEAFIIETLVPDEDMTGIDGDRFRYDPTLGYELPVGTVHETDAGEEMILPREGNLAQEVFFNAEGMMADRGDRKVVHKMRPMETQDQVFAKTKELPLDPTAEAEGIMDEMTDEEVDMAYTVAKEMKIDPSMTKAEILEALGIDASKTGVFNKEIKPRLRVIKKLKNKPNWNSRWTARRAKMKKKFGSRIGKGKGRPMMPFGHGVSDEKRAKRCDAKCRATHPFNKEKKRACVDKCTTRESFKDKVTNRQDGAMWGGHRNDGKPTLLPPIPEKLKPKKPVFSNKQKRDACGKGCGAKHPFNKSKRNKCKDGCWAKFP